MNWGQLLLIIVSYCGSFTSHLDRNQCRDERVDCMRRIAASPIFKDDATIGVNACLTDGKYQPPAPPKVPSPAPSPSPSGNV